MQDSPRLTCGECGQENEADSNFCRNCGAILATGPPAPLTCPACGQENEPDSNFCRNCGSALGAGPAPAAPPAALVCPRCQHGNEPGSAYCYSCGLPLTGEGRRASTARQGLPAFALGSPSGFWVRAGGLIIDAIVATALFALALEALTDSSLVEYFRTAYDEGAALHHDLINIVISFGYATLLVGAFATTVGKRPFKMYILRVDGTRVGYGRALGREAAKVLSYLTLGIGFLIVAFRADRRALHDLIAGTVVIRREDA